MFCLGAAAGSFANVAILRWGQDGSVLRPARSYCYACKAPIAAKDNIPILSYFLLGGKCRNCGTEFSIRYALIEILVGLLFVLTVHVRYPIEYNPIADTVLFDPAVFFYLPVIVALVIVTWTDFDEMIVPNTVTYPGTVYGLVLAALVQFTPLDGSFHVRQFFGTDTFTWLDSTYAFFSLDPVYGALAGAVPLYVIGVVGKLIARKDAMGLGDVKLLMFMGTILGWRLILCAMFLGIFLGAFCGVALILSRRSEFGRQIPFGPYLALACLICLLWGEAVLAGVHWWFFGPGVGGSAGAY